MNWHIRVLLIENHFHLGVDLYCQGAIIKTVSK